MLARLSYLMFGKKPVGEVGSPIQKDYHSVLIPATTEFGENGLDDLVIKRLKKSGFINDDFAQNSIVNCCNSRGRIIRLEAGSRFGLNKKIEFFLRVTNDEPKHLYIVPMFKGYELYAYHLNKFNFELDGDGDPLTGKQVADIKNLLIQSKMDKGVLPKVIPADKELKESGIAQVIFDRYKMDFGIKEIPACGIPRALAYGYYGVDNFNYSIEIYEREHYSDHPRVMIRLSTTNGQRPAGNSYRVDDILNQDEQLNVIKRLIGGDMLIGA